MVRFFTGNKLAAIQAEMNKFLTTANVQLVGFQFTSVALDDPVYFVVQHTVMVVYTVLEPIGG